MAAKEFNFGGLPTTLFDNIVAFLQTTATCPGGAPGAEVAAALSVLASLAREEHAAAASSVEINQMDAVFMVIVVNDAFKAVQSAGAATLPVELANLKLKLDGLKDFWNGK